MFQTIQLKANMIGHRKSSMHKELVYTEGDYIWSHELETNSRVIYIHNTDKRMVPHLAESSNNSAILLCYGPYIYLSRS